MLGDIVVKFLSSIIDSFKQKNPVVFAILAVFLLSIYFVIGTVLNYEVTPGVLLIVKEGVRNVLSTIQGVLVVVLTVLGSHTPTNFKFSNRAYIRQLPPNK